MKHEYETLFVADFEVVPWCRCGWVGTSEDGVKREGVTSSHRLARQFVDHLVALTPVPA